jgi:hypothetical protein
VPLTYAVFTERSGTLSAPAVAAPVVVAADADVRCQAQDGQVVVTWSVPEHAVGAEVVRQTVGEPASPIVLAGAEAGRLVDTGVRNGVRYRYTVRIAYSDPGGRRLWSGGRSQDVTPRKRPAPPGPLIVTGSRPEFGFSEHKTQIRCPPPERGIVKVVRQAGSESLHNGDQRPEGDLRRDGLVLEGTPPVADFWIDKGITRCSYVPVLVLDGVGHVGPARRYALAPEPSDLQGEFIGAAVRLGWAWPEGHDEMLVGYDTTEQPLDPTAARGQVRVGRARGDRAGGCDISAARDERMFVIVATVVKHDGIDFMTSGVPLRVDRPTALIEYEVRSAGLRRPELVLRATQPVAVPALMLRGRTGKPPETRDDGRQLLELDPMRLTGRYAKPLPKKSEGLNYRLFTAHTADAASVRLEPR